MQNKKICSCGTILEFPKINRHFWFFLKWKLFKHQCTVHTHIHPMIYAHTHTHAYMSMPQQLSYESYSFKLHMHSSVACCSALTVHLYCIVWHWASFINICLGFPFSSIFLCKNFCTPQSLFTSTEKNQKIKHSSLSLFRNLPEALCQKI